MSGPRSAVKWPRRAVKLTGEEPQLPSSFRAAAAAQASVAATGLPPPKSGNCAAGNSKVSRSNMRHAVVECARNVILRVDGKAAAAAWDAIAGVYRPRCRRCVRLHTSARHHETPTCGHLQAGGADVALCGSNPLSTQTNVARTSSRTTGSRCSRSRVKTRDLLRSTSAPRWASPDITMDDGAESGRGAPMIALTGSTTWQPAGPALGGDPLGADAKHSSPAWWARPEETTTGVIPAQGDGARRRVAVPGYRL